MPRGPTDAPSRRSSEDSRERIRVAAGKLFATAGFHATTMDDVAAAVGLNKATIYHYFSSKSDLLYDLYDAGLDLGLAGLEGISDDMPADIAIAKLVRYHVNSIASHPHLVAIYFQEMSWLSNWLSRQQFRAVRAKEDTYSHFLTGLIERGIAEGSLRYEDSRIASFVIVGMMAWTHQWLRPRGRLSPDEVSDRLIEIILKGLASGPRPPIPAAL